MSYVSGMSYDDSTDRGEYELKRLPPDRLSGYDHWDYGDLEMERDRL